jgi:UDP-3-O-acyl-N-acetylglucosamine deacetylase
MKITEETFVEEIAPARTFGFLHLVAHRGGHALHTAFAARILEERDAWRLVEAPIDPELAVPVGAGAAARLAN